MSNMGRGRPPKRIHRRVKSVHRDSTIKYGNQFRVVIAGGGRRKPTTVPKKVRKAPQVHRPLRKLGQHGAAYGVSQGKSGRLSQQKFRHLTVKAAKILGYPQRVGKMNHLGQTKLPPRRDGGGGRHPEKNILGLTEYEKLALALAEGKGLLK